MRYLMPLLAAATSIVSTAAAHADLGEQLAKLLPDDGAASDRFGGSVAISGATAIDGDGTSPAHQLRTSPARSAQG